MHRKSHVYLFTFISFLLTSCTQRNQSESVYDFISVTEISVPSISKDEVENWLSMDSYIVLSSDYLLNEIERVVIGRDRIYILDDDPKIVCYNMKGKVLFHISNRGMGPGEYQNIKDFGMDWVSERLVAFDNAKRKLYFYNSKTGEFLGESSTSFMAPTEMGIIEDGFFFKNMDVRFDVQKAHQYYLLYSEDGTKIDDTFLEHDAVADFNFDMDSFFYNEGSLLFSRPFDNKVYSLTKDSISPIFEIHLPNMLPLKMIKDKIDHFEIPSSGYSYGIGDVYIAEDILHFTFSKDGYLITNFFDLKDNSMLYSGVRVLGDSRKSLPVYSPIGGVYKDKFFSLVSAYSIVDRVKDNPQFFSKELASIKDDDNHVLVFYTIKQP